MRRRDVLAGGALAAALRASPLLPASGNEPGISHSFPDLRTTREGPDVVRGVFHFALGDLFSNIRMYKSGVLEQDCPCLCAGADYGDPWTRDAAINTWNGAGLVFPEVAKYTLLSSLGASAEGPAILGQYWDKIIWTLGAWHYYLYTGDRAFLKLAFDASRNTLGALERDEFDSVCGLFRGAAVYGDGVSAYPALYTNTGKYEGGEWVSTITKWVSQNPSLRVHPGFGLPMHALSTNCVYYAVYRTLPLMARELNAAADAAWDLRAANLRTAINRQFWDGGANSYRYLIDPNGNSACQEGLGVAFALLFGIANQEQREAIFRAAYISPAGIPCLWPPFERYVNQTRTSYGRHSGTVWPFIQGFWGHAAALAGQPTFFAHELNTLTAHAWRDKQFVEVYHPDSGLPYGGIQESNTEPWHEWKSCDRQSWSASGYLRLILMGLFGMRFDVDGIRFRPCVPAGCASVRLRGLRYREAELDIDVNGSGWRASSCRVNGVSRPEGLVPASARGTQCIEIELAGPSA